MEARKSNMVLLFLLIATAGATIENGQAVFQHQGRIVLGNEYCHVVVDLNLNNLTKEVAEIIHTSETVIKLVEEDGLKPYMAGHLNLLHSANSALQDAFAGLVLILGTSLPSMHDVPTNHHLLHHRPNLGIEEDPLELQSLEQRLNITLSSHPEEDGGAREPRQAGLLTSILALGTSIFGQFDLNQVSRRVNNLESHEQHYGMMMKRQDLLTSKALNASQNNRKAIQAMISQEEKFTRDNQQMSAIHMLASTCNIMTRAVDQLAGGLQLAQEGRMSPHLIDKRVLQSLHYTLTQRVQQEGYYLVTENALGLMKSPVTLVGHPLPPNGYTLPHVQLLIHVPITRTGPYQLLKYLDVPVHSKYPNLFISYDTQGYLAIEDNRKTFAELSEQDLDDCFPLEDTLLCPHIKVVQSGTKSCLMAIFTNEEHEKACATKVEHGTFNIKTLKPGLHLLTTLESLSLTYHYEDDRLNGQDKKYPPGSYHLQLNDTIKFVSSPHFTIWGTMRKSIQLEEHLTYKALDIDIHDFNIKEDHTHSHPLLTPIDANLSDFESLTMAAETYPLSNLADPISISRAVLVTLFILGVLGSAFCIFRRCRPRRWKIWAGAHRGCCRTTPSLTSTELKTAALHASTPAIVDDNFGRRGYPPITRHLQEIQRAPVAGPSQPQHEELLPQEGPSNPENHTSTAVPNEEGDNYSCGQ